MQNLGVDSSSSRLSGRLRLTLAVSSAVADVADQGGLTSQLSQPLDQIKSINSNALVGNIASNLYR
jgi:hypothetical protein